MKGFFYKSDLQLVARPDGKSLSCYSCGLYKNVLSPKMQPYGNFRKKIMVIGEAPGEEEDKRERPWQGRDGMYFKKTLAKLGIDLFEDCVCVNSVNCRPTKKGGNRTPTNFEIDCCRQQIVNPAIEKYKPKVIILVGAQAVYSVIGVRWKKELGPLTKWRGWTIPDQDLKAWICPIFHPSYVMKGEASEVIKVWEEDIKQIVSILHKPFPVFKEPNINVIDDLRLLRKKISNGESIAFDFETTGLKPQAEEHKIVCASVAYTEDDVFAFMFPEEKRKFKPFTDILKNKFILKIAQNMKYEDNWCNEILKTPVKGWHWDTVQATHILDQRPGITSLKFQAYVQFGISDYDSEISPYLKATDEKNGNSLNRVLELVSTKEGKDKLLKYCAWDSVLEFRLAMKQMKEFNQS